MIIIVRIDDDGDDDDDDDLETIFLCSPYFRYNPV